ncbi:MAG TPA: hypothetical protein VMR06_11230 [Dokdonella sp.]|uniref:hypothetical protein n=1 Tax=Dokdonella sp. TaxID=2291710 RepID=UPI002B8D9BF8|nr:hypothetical protein [Dokdonella sp.]HUD42551.1 hypothetical protein [Dokdonella sp.]
MNPFRKLSFMLGSLAFVCAANAADFVELNRYVYSFGKTGVGGFAVADVDADGVQDVVFGAFREDSLLLALGRDADGALRFKQQSIVPDDAGNWPRGSGLVRVLAWSENGEARIVTIGHNGMARIYGQWPLRELRHFSTRDTVNSGDIGDIDNDGVAELIIADPNGFQIYSLATGNLLREHATPGSTAVALAQLDGDPALEIILGGSAPGLVLDGTTFATDWSYPGGFGSLLAVGPSPMGGVQNWASAAAGSTGFDLFGSQPWQQNWHRPTDRSIASIAMAADTGSAANLLLIGSVDGSVTVFDTATQSERFGLTNGNSKVEAVTTADIDGDGTAEIVLTATQGSGVALLVADGQSGATRWSFSPTQLPYSMTSIADVDDDGREELLSAANTMSPGAVTMTDSATGTVRWTSPGSSGSLGDAFRIETRTIGLAQRNSDDRLRVVLSGTARTTMVHGMGRIVVTDPPEMAPSLTIGGMPQDSFGGILHAVPYDFDHDGNDDLISAETRTTSGVYWPRLRVLSLLDGTVLWTSGDLGGPFAAIKRVFVAPGATSADDLFITATSTGLFAFRPPSSAAVWQLTVANDGAAYLAEGVAGAEIVSFTRTGELQFFAAATQAPVRTFATGLTLLDVIPLGRADALLAVSSDRLLLLDGRTGIVRASTPYLGPFDTDILQVGVSYQGGGVWHLAPATKVTTYRYKLILTEAIFEDGFEIP